MFFFFCFCFRFGFRFFFLLLLLAPPLNSLWCSQSPLVVRHFSCKCNHRTMKAAYNNCPALSDIASYYPPPPQVPLCCSPHSAFLSLLPHSNCFFFFRPLLLVSILVNSLKTQRFVSISGRKRCKVNVRRSRRSRNPNHN